MWDTVDVCGACRFALPCRMIQIRARTRRSYIALPPSELHTVTVRDNSFVLNLRSAAILPGLLSYLSHSGMINVSFKQFDQPVFQNDGWYAGGLYLMKLCKFSPCSEIFMWNTCSGYGIQIYRVLLRNVSYTFTLCAWQTGDWLDALFIVFVLSSSIRVWWNVALWRWVSVSWPSKGGSWSYEGSCRVSREESRRTLLNICKRRHYCPSKRRGPRSNRRKPCPKLREPRPKRRMLRPKRRVPRL